MNPLDCKCFQGHCYGEYSGAPLAGAAVGNTHWPHRRDASPYKHMALGQPRRCAVATSFDHFRSISPGAWRSHASQLIDTKHAALPHRLGNSKKYDSKSGHILLGRGLVDSSSNGFNLPFEVFDLDDVSCLELSALSLKMLEHTL